MKLHRFDALSFIAGLVATAIGLMFLLTPDVGAIIDFVTDFGSWFWPVVFVAIGVGILTPLVVRSTTGGQEPDEDG